MLFIVYKFILSEDVPLQCLSDLAASLPKILIPHFASIFALCSSIVANQEKDESYRHSNYLFKFCLMIFSVFR